MNKNDKNYYRITKVGLTELGKTVLVKAHFAYRRKGAVNETAVTDYIV